jgi:hypothetical protein
MWGRFSATHIMDTLVDVVAGAPCDWTDLPDLLAAIAAPEFPDRDFIVTDFGTRAGDPAGAAIAAAIARAAGA